MDARPGKDDRERFSSIVPRRFLRRRVRPILQRAGDRLPRGWTEALVRFFVETRIVFSRTALALVIVLFALFALSVNKMGGMDADRMWFLMVVQCIALAGFLNMGIFQAERRAHTLEILRSRVGSTGALLRLKIAPALFWQVALLTPVHAGFSWFLGIAPGASAVQFIFLAASGVVTALATCVAATFLRNGFGAAVAATIILIPVASFMNGSAGTVRAALAPFLKTIGEDGAWAQASLAGRLALGAVNLVVVALYAAGLFIWLRNRLERTEKWFL